MARGFWPWGSDTQHLTGEGITPARTEWKALSNGTQANPGAGYVAWLVDTFSCTPISHKQNTTFFNQFPWDHKRNRKSRVQWDGL